MNSTQTTENKSQPSGVKQSVVETAKQAASEVKKAASATASRAVEGMQKTALERKIQTANRVEAYSSAIHDSARSLEQDDPNIAWFTHQAADRLQRVASYVRERDFQGFRQDAESLARRHPVAFFGGMALAGLVLGNIVKASRKNLAENGNDESSPDFSVQPEQDYAPSSTSIDQSATAGI